MDSKYVRTKVETLLAELERNPALGRRRSPSFMNRYGRPLGLGLALGVSGAVGCSGSSESKTPDAMPAPKDAYAVPDSRRDSAPDTVPAQAEVGIPDVPADTRDVLPPRVDAYGVVARDAPPYLPVDAPDARIPDGSVGHQGCAAVSGRCLRRGRPTGCTRMCYPRRSMPTAW